MREIIGENMKKKIAWIISHCVQLILFVATLVTTIDAINILKANDLSALAGIVILPIALVLLSISLLYSIVCLMIHIFKNSRKLMFVQFSYLLIELIIVMTLMLCIL